MFKVICSNGDTMIATDSMTRAMDWVIDKSREYMHGYVTWFEPEASELGRTIIMFSCAGLYYKLVKS